MMILHLNGSEEVNIKDKDNGFQEITINGIDLKLPDGTTQKSRMVIPNSRFEPAMSVNVSKLEAYADNVDKSLWTLELKE